MWDARWQTDRVCLTVSGLEGGRRIEKESLCNKRRYRAAFLERSKMCPRVCLSVIVSEKERERERQYVLLMRICVLERICPIKEEMRDRELYVVIPSRYLDLLTIRG